AKLGEAGHHSPAGFGRPPPRPPAAADGRRLQPARALGRSRHGQSDLQHARDGHFAGLAAAASHHSAAATGLVFAVLVRSAALRLAAIRSCVGRFLNFVNDEERTANEAVVSMAARQTPEEALGLTVSWTTRHRTFRAAQTPRSARRLACLPGADRC